MATTAWPLVGRTDDLRLAGAALAGAALAGGPGVLITGPVGAGRTRLADEVLDQAEQAGTPVVRLSVTRAAATIPFGAAAPLLAPAAGLDPGAAAPGPAPASGSGPRLASPKDGTLLAARQAFAARADGGVVLVGVDDAHLLDDATAALLAALVDDGRVRLVLTVPTGEPMPDAVRALWHDQGWRHLDLAELTEAEVRELLVEVLGGEVESATVARLWQATRGNALFLRELCRDALDAGALAPRHGVWTWAPGPFTGPRLHDLVLGRIGALTGDERHLAGLLALGEPLGVSLLARLSDPEVAAAMRDRGLIGIDVVDGREVARLAHPLYADGMRAQLGPLETADLYAALVRGTLAEAEQGATGPLDPAGLDPDERLRLAVWSISSHVEADPALLASAAADARDHDDPALAERLARAALGQSPSTGIARPPAPVPPPCVVSFDAALTLGEALSDLLRPEEAEAVLDPLAGIARDDRERARVAVARLAALRLVPDGAARAREAAAAAEAGITDAANRDLVRAALADALSHLGALDEAGRLAEELLETAAPAVRPRAVAAATIWLALVGRSDAAVKVAAHAAPGIPQGREGGAGRRSSAAAAIVGLISGGRVVEAEATVAQAVDDPVSRRHLYGGTLALMHGRIALSRGRPATARVALGEAAVVLGRADQLGRHAWTLSLLAEAHALLGDAGAAADSLAARPTVGQSARYQHDIQRAEVWALVAAGDLAGAAAVALERAEMCRAAGHIGYELTFLDLAVRMAPGHEVLARGRAVAPAVEGPFAPAFAAYCEALAADDGPALDRASASYAALGLDLHAAEAATHAARAHRRARAGRAAAQAEDQARRLAARCEGARTPALAGGTLVGVLTPREREVALLAARGLPSRAIAQRLDVSVRTVDNQLGRVYRKLGVSSRAELAALLAHDA